eukprot:CAMPEP_0202498350 /NCGR_PEP_ID=MMETSP1361-20130828/25721_1 /ASSEMBLY_ACC=CAM_ASM_000849 /TAXON_ID=210615 /ORGANISM="Staurosira complex sp., Strain CCMP2646" /LENGTH=517 /DNA_ID=CAMNT_0049130207 /DNA_START=108 /DNA_END=1661 /DNA_ORIENTATION=-
MFREPSSQSRLLMALVLALFTSAVVGQESTCDLIGPAVIKGKKFFDSRSGKYIPLKGVNYYPRPNTGELSTGKNRDFFSKESRAIWERDIQEFQKLGINVVRIYAVDPGLDHSGFMCALQQAGIYAIIGLAASCQDCAITGEASPDCYPVALKERGQFVINIFSKYENVLAFSAGNEAQLYAPGKPPEHNAPCQKQFIRDMRAYIDSCENLRKIPIGLAVADFSREEKAMYYNCRSDPDDEFENAEWYGLNVYLHCDPTADTVDDLDGFNDLLESHQNYSMSIPVIITEYGCENKNFPTIDGFEGQRNFLQVDALYSPDYEDYFAGGIVFEYSVEKTEVDEETNVTFPYQQHAPNNWGLGYFRPSDCDDIDTTCIYTPYPEFDTLAEKYAAADGSGVPDLNSFNPGKLEVTECPSNFPALDTFTWESTSIDDLDCVGPNYVFVCPNLPTECLPPFAQPPPAPSPPPTTAPTIAATKPPGWVPTAEIVPDDATSGAFSVDTSALCCVMGIVGMLLFGL